MAKGLREAAKGYSPGAAAHLVRARAKAVRAHGVDVGDFQAERQSLLEFFRDRGICENRDCFDGLDPVSGGAEHTVFHDAAGGRAIKVTRPNSFGHSVYAFGKTLSASPLEYLLRLAWHNLLFGDDITIVGGHCDEEGLQVITSQPWILFDEAPLATDDQIDGYFSRLGFKRARLYPDGYFYCNSLGFAVADAGPSNVVLSNDGTVIPIDVVIGRLSADHRYRIRVAEGQARNPRLTAES